MVIKLYVSNTCGNRTMHAQQIYIKNLLEMKKVPFEEIDVADPNYRKDKKVMQAKLRINDDDLHALPPQIFNGEEHKGDFESFFSAVEEESTYTYLDVDVPKHELEFIRIHEPAPSPAPPQEQPPQQPTSTAGGQVVSTLGYHKADHSVNLDMLR